MVKAFFWVCLLTILYVHIGYPAIIAGLALLFPSRNKKKDIDPSVAIVVVSRNEEKYIREKLENLLSLNYPPEKRRIVLVSDCSTDRTEEIATTFAERGVELLRIEERGGKPAALNRVIPALKEEIIILSDSRQLWNGDAVRALVSNFADDNVGAVSGELHIVGDKKGGSVGQGVGLYWKYEKFIRRHEALFDSTCGATGCIYAIRRSLFEAIPNDTLLDDFVIPMNIVKKGKRVVFEENAMAIDAPSDTPEHEMKRKIRTLAGNYQAIVQMPWLLIPWRNRLFFQLVSHKLLRLVVPFLMIAVFLLNIGLMEHYVYRICFVGQVMFYLLGAVPASSRCQVPGAIRAFLLLNLAALIALPVFVAGRQRVTWR